MEAAPTGDERQLLGNELYKKIAVFKPKMAAKLTGMLLEMPTSEVVKYINDKAALREKVAEAVDVYRTYIEEQREGAKRKANMDALNDMEWLFVDEIFMSKKDWLAEKAAMERKLPEAKNKENKACKNT